MDFLYCLVFLVFALSTVEPFSLTSEKTDVCGKNYFASRREFFHLIASASAALPAIAHAQDNATKVVDMLKSIPTFCIVDEMGVPFMVVGEDAKVTGYFFTSFEEADRLLKLASKSADQAIRVGDDPSASNPWKSARISTVTMDIALTIISKNQKGNYFYLAPDGNNIVDALRITGDPDLREGKVPLFYDQDMVLEGSTPAYFSRQQLLQTKNDAVVSVTELTAVVSQLVNNNSLDVTIVPPTNSAKKAALCNNRQSKKAANFVVGQRIIVL